VYEFSFWFYNLHLCRRISDVYRFDKLNKHRESQERNNKQIFPANIYPLKGNPPKRQIIEKQGAI